MCGALLETFLMCIECTSISKSTKSLYDSEKVNEHIGCVPRSWRFQSGAIAGQITSKLAVNGTDTASRATANGIKNVIEWKASSFASNDYAIHGGVERGRLPL